MRCCNKREKETNKPRHKRGIAAVPLSSGVLLPFITSLECAVGVVAGCGDTTTARTVRDRVDRLF